jgi:DNA-binding Lrp family transcriptional regulator
LEGEVSLLQKLFESLLTIKNQAELKLTLLILARATGSGEHCVAVTYAELQSSTGLSPASVAKGIKKMLARGYIVRYTVTRKQSAQYQVLWDKLGMPTAPGISSYLPETITEKPQITFAGRLESYFTETGFLDLLPMAADIANQLGYGDAEMIEAVCMVFDKEDASDYTPFKLAG